jgi:RNA polymerase sigma-70 factor (ECF subfamily)
MVKKPTAGETDELTDEELVRLSLQNKQHFYSLIKRYEKKILRYVYRISESTQPESEDILQDIFIKAYCNLNGFNQNLKFSSWIYRIAHNETINFLRKNRIRLQNSFVRLNDDDICNLSLFIHDQSHPDQTLLTRDKEDKLRELLVQLPRKYREVLVLRYLEDKKYGEISDILQKPPGTVATLIKRAKSKFKKMVKNDWLKGEP